MTTFDDILPAIREQLQAHRKAVDALQWLIINLDLYGRVRLVVPNDLQADPTRLGEVQALAAVISHRLGAHGHPADSSVLFESSRDPICSGASAFQLEGLPNVWVVDRLASEGSWAAIAAETRGAHRVVFFSIKGGVGRSTALAATAWALAQAGRRVLVLDLDLESPGLSTALLPSQKQPTYGISDWLVEDLVDNAGAVIDAMVATSDLAHDGEIYVVPAHGANPGEYVSKLGRAWMPRISENGSRENWSQRLQRLVNAFEQRVQPDVILIDSRSGIDDIASSCVTDLGANLVLLFSLEGDQTWSGYRILFNYWWRAQVVGAIRNRLQIVSALTPEIGRLDYLQGLRENAYDLFAQTLYDEIPVGEAGAEQWHFETSDETAPHYPWEVRWHRSFAGLRSLHGRIATIDAAEVRGIFGPLIDGLARTLGWENVNG